MEMPEIKEIMTRDLNLENYAVFTYYGVTFIIGKDGITEINPFHRPEKRVYQGEVKINSCRVGGWLSARVDSNGGEPFISNSICITKIEAEP